MSPDIRQADGNANVDLAVDRHHILLLNIAVDAQHMGTVRLRDEKHPNADLIILK